MHWAVTDTARQAWQRLKMPQDRLRRRLQRPELREPHPGAEVSAAVHARRLDEVHPGAGRVPLRALRQRAGHHQADRVFVRRARPPVGDRERWTIRTCCCNGEPGDDQIKILEDTNGDGRADKVTVFADRLNIPTSLAFANGGVIVDAAPHTLFLKDTNGDDKADVREMLSTGWGIRDTPRRPVQHAVRARQPHLGRRRLFGLQGRDEREEAAVRAGRRSGSSRTAAPASST